MLGSSLTYFTVAFPWHTTVHLHFFHTLRRMLCFAVAIYGVQLHRVKAQTLT